MRVEVEGLEELRMRFAAFPQKYAQSLKKTMEAALLVLWGSVPGYPHQPPGSDYIRTGTLGRSMGSSESGGSGGNKPDIYTVKQSGTYAEAEFGTALNYAQYVIGEQQAWMHRSRWWNVKTLATKAEKGIVEVFQTMADELARWLDAGK